MGATETAVFMLTIAAMGGVGLLWKNMSYRDALYLRIGCLFVSWIVMVGLACHDFGVDGGGEVARQFVEAAKTIELTKALGTAKFVNTLPPWLLFGAVQVLLAVLGFLRHSSRQPIDRGADQG